MTNEVIEAKVINYNKGGLLVNLDGVRGFVPSSQVSGISRGPETQKQSDMAKMVGSSMPLKVIEINRNRNRLILSERQAVQEVREGRKDELLTTLKEGDVRSGVVTSIADFGAFVDIGGADGLVHLSELSWSRVKHPSEVLKPGDKVKVYILSVDNDRKRIALSIKRTQNEPWTTVNDRYHLGQVVEGTITQLAILRRLRADRRWGRGLDPCLRDGRWSGSAPARCRAGGRSDTGADHSDRPGAQAHGLEHAPAWRRQRGRAKKSSSRRISLRRAELRGDVGERIFT